jgi:hypothetical protein
MQSSNNDSFNFSWIRESLTFGRAKVRGGANDDEKRTQRDEGHLLRGERFAMPKVNTRRNYWYYIYDLATQLTRYHTFQVCQESDIEKINNLYKIDHFLPPFSWEHRAQSLREG